MSHFPLLYLAFHGDPEVIYVGDKRRKDSSVSLDELGEMLRGKCTKQIIHFGSCSTLQTDKRNIDRFLRTTDALAVTGYRTAVGWMESAAFELLLFDALQGVTLTKQGIDKWTREVDGQVGGLARRLEFRILRAS
jgi:hypothetical protein